MHPDSVQENDMSEFHLFSAAVAERFAALSAHELFVVDTDGTDLFQLYLDAFPAGTNPIFRTRTEHDCSCCKQFIRNIGRVVAIVDGSIQTVWDDLGQLPEPYATVAMEMREAIRSCPIQTVYRTKERQYGNAYTLENTNDGVHRWHHFVGRIADRHYSAQPDKARGELEAAAQVLRRGITEIPDTIVSDIIDLIDAKALYRGEEHLPALHGFRALQQRAQGVNLDVFVWSNIGDRAARFRNTVIGTLAVDLADGVELERAVKSFETKVAPANYKRPTALITPKMIEQAVEKLKELGLESAVERRMATIEDVSVNNVLFVDNAVRGQMKDSGGLTGLLMSAAKPGRAPRAEDAEPISVDDFFANVVPSASSIALLVENSHLGNFVTLTAPQEAGPGRLFRWNNDFAWSYDGEVTDGIKQRVKAAGGKTGADVVLRVSLAWSNPDDLDIHCHGPDGHIYYFNRMGILDVDMNAGGPRDEHNPVENLSWTHPRDGRYRISVNNYTKRLKDRIGFTIEMENAGRIQQFSYPKDLNTGQTVDVMTFEVSRGVVRNIALGAGVSGGDVSTDKWGVKTQTLVPVDTIMLSPNHWDGQGVGNRHWFFFLKGCQNPDAVRGIYNEFLRPELEQHRKVFEVLGSKTKCPPTADQLSGLGFSSTRGDSVVAVVNNGRAYRVQF